MGLCFLLGLYRPSRQLAGLFESKCLAFLLQARVFYPPQATSAPLIGMGWVLSQALLWGEVHRALVEGHPAHSPLRSWTLQP